MKNIAGRLSYSKTRSLAAEFFISPSADTVNLINILLGMLKYALIFNSFRVMVVI